MQNFLIWLIKKKVSLQEKEKKKCLLNKANNGSKNLFQQPKSCNHVEIVGQVLDFSIAVFPTAPAAAIAE